MVTFGYLWTIFKPGIDVFTSQNGYDRFYRLKETKYEEICDETTFLLTVQCVDCDGQKFGWATSHLVIRPFDGTKSLADLEIIPAGLHPCDVDLKRVTSTRGEKLETSSKNPFAMRVIMVWQQALIGIFSMCAPDYWRVCLVEAYLSERLMVESSSTLQHSSFSMRQSIGLTWRLLNLFPRMSRSTSPITIETISNSTQAFKEVQCIQAPLLKEEMLQCMLGRHSK